MNSPYSLSEDDFNKLERAQESITLVSILFGEVQRSSTYTPQMIASLLEALGEDIVQVIQSMTGGARKQCIGTPEVSDVR